MTGVREKQRLGGATAGGCPGTLPGLSGIVMMVRGAAAAAGCHGPGARKAGGDPAPGGGRLWTGSLPVAEEGAWKSVLGVPVAPVCVCWSVDAGGSSRCGSFAYGSTGKPLGKSQR